MKRQRFLFLLLSLGLLCLATMAVPAYAHSCDDAFMICYSTCQEPGPPAPACIQFCRQEELACERQRQQQGGYEQV